MRYLKTLSQVLILIPCVLSVVMWSFRDTSAHTTAHPTLIPYLRVTGFVAVALLETVALVQLARARDYNARTESISTVAIGLFACGLLLTTFWL